jgi:high-affinity nickel-transport protein
MRVQAVSEPTLRERLSQFRGSLTRKDRRSLAGMSSVVLLLHVIGFGVLFGFVAPQYLRLGGDHPVFTVGVGILAYTFGLRHAFDADHIAEVDNTTRKLIADNVEREAAGQPRQRRPLSVGGDQHPMLGGGSALHDPHRPADPGAGRAPTSAGS